MICDNDKKGPKIASTGPLSRIDGSARTAQSALGAAPNILNEIFGSHFGCSPNRSNEVQSTNTKARASQILFFRNRESTRHILGVTQGRMRSLGKSNKEHQLDAAWKEIERLKQSLMRKDHECVELRDNSGIVSTQLMELEAQCRDRTAKVAELMEILGAKTQDAIGKKLIEKGLQNAEYQVQVTKLQKRLNDMEWELTRAKKEKMESKQDATQISKDHDQLTQELQVAKADNENLMKERETYKPLILELSDVVRSLSTISVTYSKVEKDHLVPSSAAEAQVHSLRNVKRKVAAIEEDRQLLFKEKDVLRAEIEAKNQRIMTLESQCRIHNKYRLDKEEVRSLADLPASGMEIGGTQHEKHWELQQSEIAQTDGSTKFTEEADVLSTSSSSSNCSETSSFSSIEPPSIALEKYEKLRHEHQAALSKVAELEELLQTAPVAEEKFQESKALQSIMDDILENNPGAADDLAKVHLMYSELRRKSHQTSLQYWKLKRDYDDALKDHISQYKKFKKEFKNATSAHDQRNSVLEEVRSVAMKKQIVKYEQLKVMVEKSQQIQRDALDKLKEDHDVAVKLHSKQYEDIKQEYEDALVNHARIVEELRRDREIHVDENIQELTMKYKRASQRSCDLEKELVLARQENEVQVKHLVMSNKKADNEAKSKLQRLKQQYRIDIEERTVLEKELQEVVKKAEQRAQESYHKLKQEYDLLEAEKLEIEEELGCLKRQFQVQSLASDEYSDVKHTYEGGNIKIKPGASINVDKGENELLSEALANTKDSKNVLLVGHPPGRVLSGDTYDPIREVNSQSQQSSKDIVKAQPGKTHLSISQEAELPDPREVLEKIVKLEDELLKDAETAPRTQEDRFNRLKSDYILHQHRLKRVHNSIVGKAVLPEAVPSIEPAVDPKIMYRLLHQQKLQIVNEAIESKLSVKCQNHEIKNICSSGPNGEKNSEDCFDSLEGSVETIVISAMEEGRNSDEIAKDAFRFGESAIFRSSGSIPKSLHICKNLSHVSSISQSISQVDTRGDHNNLHVRPKDIGFTDMELKQELDVAKTKISLLRQELIKTRERELNTRKEKENLKSGLREVISRYRALETQHQDVVAKLKSHDLEGNDGQQKKNLENDLKKVISQYRKLERDYEDLLKQHEKPATSSSVTDLTASRSWSSAFIPEDPSMATRSSRIDMRDSYSACSNRKRVGGGYRDSLFNCEIGSHGSFMRLRQEHDAATAKISAIGKELDDAKKVAEAAEKKQASREKHLREVITQYKKLEFERDAPIAEIQDARRESGSVSGMTNLHREIKAVNIRGDSEANLTLKDIKYLSATKIVEIEKELQDARTAAQVAKLKQAEKDKHLRDVIYHYKILQAEHDDLVACVRSMKEELKSTTRAQRRKLEEAKTQKVELGSSASVDMGTTKENNSVEKCQQGEMNPVYVTRKNAPAPQITPGGPEIRFV